MERITGANTVDLGGGRQGFRDRNLAAGLAGTKVPAAWLNPLQEELLAIVEQADLTPNSADWGQVLAALRSMFCPGVQGFGTSGWFTVPAGITRVRACVWGAGGGGGVYGSGFPSGGGGGGGYAEGVFSVTPKSSIYVTVGIGGVANAAGGASSFGALCSATGGGAGSNGSGSGVGAGGAGGVGAGGFIGLAGGGGGSGIALGSGDRAGGNGGGAYAVSATGYPWIGGSAIAGQRPGGGSSGQAAAGSTASGGDGFVIVGW